MGKYLSIFILLIGFLYSFVTIAQSTQDSEYVQMVVNVARQDIEYTEQLEDLTSINKGNLGSYVDDLSIFFSEIKRHCKDIIEEGNKPNCSVGKIRAHVYICGGVEKVIENILDSHHIDRSQLRKKIKI